MGGIYWSDKGLVWVVHTGLSIYPTIPCKPKREKRLDEMMDVAVKLSKRGGPINGLSGAATTISRVLSPQHPTPHGIVNVGTTILVILPPRRSYAVPRSDATASSWRPAQTVSSPSLSFLSPLMNSRASWSPPTLHTYVAQRLNIRSKEEGLTEGVVEPHGHRWDPRVKRMLLFGA
ncbi:hypothetical protein BHM03_00013651 [Ensete ventricosum]|nr:hypothetical protein BHM03_00013651 [Ensete ventricosum]